MLAETLHSLDRPHRTPVATTGGQAAADPLDLAMPRWRRVDDPGDVAEVVAPARRRKRLVPQLRPFQGFGLAGRRRFLRRAGALVSEGRRPTMPSSSDEQLAMRVRRFLYERRVAFEGNKP